MFKGRVKKIHFVGIGGIGMSGIAEILLAHGYQISGSDIKESDITNRLKSLGGTIEIGHSIQNLKDVDVVVFSSAIDESNPELVEARKRSIPVIRRAEMLAELMRTQAGIAITGSHGKTTTTSLIAEILYGAKRDPTVIIGGKLNGLGSSATLGKGDLLVAEADESDGSFLFLTPTIAVVTNIDQEHMDYYPDIEVMKDTFIKFVNRVPFYGLVVACLDDSNVRDILPQVKRRVITYGLIENADYQAVNPELKGFSSSFEMVFKGKSHGIIRVNMPGIHNVLNALAAIAVADELEVERRDVMKALKDFQGVQRRFTIVGEYKGITVVDDYGHHPTEIKATLKAARQVFNRRLIVVFQPHRYTRTYHLFQELTAAFSLSQVLIVTDVYPASEKPIVGADAESLAQAIREGGHPDVSYVCDSCQLVDILIKKVITGDVVITLGAGDITKIGPKILKVLRANNRE